MGILDNIDDIQRTLGRIEGQTQHIPRLLDRVAQLEIWQAWLKGACAVLLVAFGFLFRLLLAAKRERDSAKPE